MHVADLYERRSRWDAEVGVASCEARVVAQDAALAVTSDVFELMGARSTARRFGFDRFWRNARTIACHDTRDSKLTMIGAHALFGTAPTEAQWFRGAGGNLG